MAKKGIVVLHRSHRSSTGCSVWGWFVTTDWYDNRTPTQYDSTSRLLSILLVRQRGLRSPSSFHGRVPSGIVRIPGPETTAIVRSNLFAFSSCVGSRCCSAARQQYALPLCNTLRVYTPPSYFCAHCVQVYEHW